MFLKLKQFKFLVSIEIPISNETQDSRELFLL